MFYSLYIHSWARKIFINLDRNFGSRTGARRPSILAPCSEIVYCKLEWFQPAEIKSYAGILGLWRGTYGWRTDSKHAGLWWCSRSCQMGRFSNPSNVPQPHFCWWCISVTRNLERTARWRISRIWVYHSRDNQPQDNFHSIHLCQSKKSSVVFVLNSQYWLVLSFINISKSYAAHKEERELATLLSRIPNECETNGFVFIISVANLRPRKEISSRILIGSKPSFGLFTCPIATDNISSASNLTFEPAILMYV